MVIVDSPGIGDSEQVNKITLDYLPRAYAFIYVLNSSNTGGLQEDRVSKKIDPPSLPTPASLKYFEWRTSHSFGLPSFKSTNGYWCTIAECPGKMQRGLGKLLMRIYDKHQPYIERLKSITS